MTAVTPIAKEFAAITNVGTNIYLDLSKASTNTAVKKISIKSNPAHGSVTFGTNPLILVYTPINNYIGNDYFTYTVTSTDNVESVPKTINITINLPVPVVTAFSVSTQNNTPVIINFGQYITWWTANSSITIVTQPTHGTLVKTSAQAYTYTPVASYFGGPDSFTFLARNEKGASNTVTVTLNVAKVIGAISTTVNVQRRSPTAVNTNGLAVNTSNYSFVLPMKNGYLAINGNSINFIPNITGIGATPVDTLSYQVIDNSTGQVSKPATLTFAVI